MTTVFDIYNMIYAHCFAEYKRLHCTNANCWYCGIDYCVKDLYRTCIELVTEVL